MKIYQTDYFTILLLKVMKPKRENGTPEGVAALKASLQRNGKNTTS
jgi:hypothetical protein